MSVHDEFQKVTKALSVATSDAEAFFAPLLAELKSLEDHVLALGALTCVDKPPVQIASAADTSTHTDTSIVDSQVVDATNQEAA